MAPRRQQQVRFSALGLALLALAVSPLVTANDACLALRGRSHGKLETRCESLSYGGRIRTYQLYVPTRLHDPAPLLVVLHGGGGSGANMALMSRQTFNRIADREGVIVIYPDGVGRNWNDGRTGLRSPAMKENIDDVGFLRALVHEMSTRHHVDAKRIYSTGISNGGFMSFRLACEAADVFAAIAPVAATLSDDLGPRCHPSKPVSVAILNGTNDPLVPWAGGEVSALGIKRGTVWSAEKTLDTWAALDGCREKSDDQVIDKVPGDDTSVILHVRSQCRAGSEVRLYEIRGGGHTWPRGEKYLTERLVGKVSQELDGAEEIWRFLSAHQAE
jgi:polyhydroxybutyrate depolymerase